MCTRSAKLYWHIIFNGYVEELEQKTRPHFERDQGQGWLKVLHLQKYL